ncbi:MAG: metallophosphoesterase [Bacteroidia bacterium]|nr:metallophosphoesterase [Bacteroidia bacterium]
MKKYFSSIIFICLCLCLQAQQPDDVKVGPWVTAVRTDDACATAKILWTSFNEGTGWVELEDGTRIYDTFAGRRTVERLHCVTLSGLPAGRTVRYRVGGQALSDGSDPSYPEFSGEYTHSWNGFKTLDNVSEVCRFSMINDIHMNVGAYKSLAAQIDPAVTDFIFLCGDIASRDNYSFDKLLQYEIKPVEHLTSVIPVRFARGNHEGCGLGIQEVARIYPQADGHQGGEFYYTFRQGPVAFIVFDGGETQDRRAVLYSGNHVYEDYIEEQMRWAERAMQEPSFKDAPVKVCLIHVPMIDHPNKSSYQLHRFLNKNVVPLLNEAGIDLMLSADLHTYMLCKEGTMGNDFPILVNRNEERLDFVYENGVMKIKCFSASGKETHSLTFPVN